MVRILNGHLRRIGWTNVFRKNDEFVKQVQDLKSFIFEIFFDFFEIELEVFKKMPEKFFNHIFRTIFML